MFKKVLIANRGEIAVRILRACHELGLSVVALYQASDCSSLHVRLADESVELHSPAGFLDGEEILRIAQEQGADAIHPGYGFLAEREDFINQCQAAGVTFIGPPAAVVARLHNKIDVLKQASQAGFSTPAHSSRLFAEFFPRQYTAEYSRSAAASELSPRPYSAAARDYSLQELQDEAGRLGYPLVVKTGRGGRGRGERLVWSDDWLVRAIHRSQMEARAVYGNQEVYLEKAILPAHQIGVQIAGDRQGNLIHLGEREGSLVYGNQRIIEETPAPCLTQPQRQQLWQAALQLGKLFGYQNVGTVEFMVDAEGAFYFTEIKPRIQIQHSLTEMVTRFDLVHEQIRIAAGEPLSLSQDEVQLNGWAMQCRIRAEDPWKHFLPNAGRVETLRTPGGPDVRLDTYLYSGCDIPSEYDPLVAKLVVWGRSRSDCLARIRQALQELQLSGVPTNLPLIQRILEQPAFQDGCYTTELILDGGEEEGGVESDLRDLAVIAALAQLRQNQQFRPQVPERLLSGWHRSSRHIPE